MIILLNFACLFFAPSLLSMEKKEISTRIEKKETRGKSKSWSMVPTPLKSFSGLTPSSPLSPKSSSDSLLTPQVLPTRAKYPFIDAIKSALESNNLTHIQKLLNEGEYTVINQQDEHGFTGLHYAMKANHKPIIECLHQSLAVDFSLVDKNRKFASYYLTDKSIKNEMHYRTDLYETVRKEYSVAKFEQPLHYKDNLDHIIKNVKNSMSQLHENPTDNKLDEDILTIINSLNSVSPKSSSESLTSPTEATPSLFPPVATTENAISYPFIEAVKIALQCKHITKGKPAEKCKYTAHVKTLLECEHFTPINILLKNAQYAVINQQDAEGKTGLHHALQTNHKRTIKCLLKSFIVDFSIVDHNQKYASDYLTKKGLLIKAYCRTELAKFTHQHYSAIQREYPDDYEMHYDEIIEMVRHSMAQPHQNPTINAARSFIKQLSDEDILKIIRAIPDLA